MLFAIYMIRTNEKDYSRLSVNTALLASVESLMDVPPECFNPPPKVNSRVIKIVPQTVPVMENGKPIKMQVFVLIVIGKKVYS